MKQMKWSDLYRWSWKRIARCSATAIKSQYASILKFVLRKWRICSTSRWPEWQWGRKRVEYLIQGRHREAIEYLAKVREEIDSLSFGFQVLWMMLIALTGKRGSLMLGALLKRNFIYICNRSGDFYYWGIDCFLPYIICRRTWRILGPNSLIIRTFKWLADGWDLGCDWMTTILLALLHKWYRIVKNRGSRSLSWRI